MEKMDYELVFKDISNLKAGYFTFEGTKFDFKRENSQRSEFNSPPKINVSHWTAGSRLNIYDSYTFNTTESKGKVFVFKTLKWSEKPQHLWGRNSGAVGYTLCGMSNSLNKPTDNMIDAHSLMIAEVCCWKNILPNNKLTLPKMNKGKVISGSILAPTVADHAFFAKTDSYFPDRWDVGDYQAIIEKKVANYYQQLKAGKRKFVFLDLLKAA